MSFEELDKLSEEEITTQYNEILEMPYLKSYITYTEYVICDNGNSGSCDWTWGDASSRCAIEGPWNQYHSYGTITSTSARICGYQQPGIVYITNCRYSK